MDATPSKWGALFSRLNARPEFAIAAVAVVIRLAYVWYFLRQPELTENMRSGFTWVERGYLGDPFILPTGPTAHLAPMYPSLIAAAAWLVGDPWIGFKVARSVLVLVFGAALAALPSVSRMIGLGRGPGLVATMIFMIPWAPVFLWTETSGQHETLLTMAALVALAIPTLRVARRPEVPTPHALLLGTAWGLCAHTSPLLLTAVAGLAFAVVLQSSPPLMLRQLRTWATVGLGAALVLAPWTVRNYREIGVISLVRDNFGLELAVSNAPNASPDMQQNMGIGFSLRRHPSFDSTEARRMASMGEKAYYAARQEEAKAWIASNPDRFANLTWRRAALFLLPRDGRAFHAPFYWFVVFGGALGFVQLLRRDALTAAALAGLVVGFAAPHVLVQSHPRYGYPLLWIQALLGARLALDAARAGLRWIDGQPEVERAPTWSSSNACRTRNDGRSPEPGQLRVGRKST